MPSNSLAMRRGQYEQCLGDERDLVRVRTNYRKETVCLYRPNSSPDNVRRLLMVYLNRIDELPDPPEFYRP